MAAEAKAGRNETPSLGNSAIPTNWDTDSACATEIAPGRRNAEATEPKMNEFVAVLPVGSQYRASHIWGQARVRRQIFTNRPLPPTRARFPRRHPRVPGWRRFTSAYLP